MAASSALFDKGLKDMLAGRYKTGCPALAESFRLDPEPGTLFTVAECQRKQGKLATALAHYDDYLRLFARMTPDQQQQQRGRDKVSKTERDALASVVPRLTLHLPADAPASTIVKLQGRRLEGPSLGIALPIDPGSYTLTTQIPGGPEHEQQVSMAKGEHKDITLEVDRANAPSKPPAAVPLHQPRPAPEPEQGRASSKTWAYIAGGVGVAGIALGSVTGILALGKKATVDSQCSGTVCNAEGKQAADSGKSLALVSTVGFGVGAAGLVTAAVLLLTLPSPSRHAGISPAAELGASGGWLGAKGRW